MEQDKTPSEIFAWHYGFGDTQDMENKSSLYMLTQDICQTHINQRHKLVMCVEGLQSQGDHLSG